MFDLLKVICQTVWAGTVKLCLREGRSEELEQLNICLDLNLT